VKPDHELPSDDIVSVNFVNLLLPSSGIKPIYSEREHPEIPYSEEHTEKYQILIDRISTVLLSVDFFKQTKLKSFLISLELSHFWNARTDIGLRIYKGELYGSRRIYLADFWQMTASEFLDFETGVAAEIVLAACNKFKLDVKAAQQLVQSYPIRKTEFSLTAYEPMIGPIDPPSTQPFHPLTNEEFVFSNYNPYQWCVAEPFTEEQLRKIGPETLTVCAPIDLPVDQYVQVANAMQRAPLATLRIVGFHQGNDLRFLKYFPYLSRLCLDFDQLVDLTCLRNLSPDLVHLELNFYSKPSASSLDALEHFRSIQSLRLRGHYEDLSRFPNLKGLKALMLSKVSMKDLNSLSSFCQLQSLALADSKINDINAISSLVSLKYLGLARLPKLTTLPNLSKLEQLEYLNLVGLTNLDRFSSLNNAKRLRRLSLDGLKRLSNLDVIDDAENLEELLICDMKNLSSQSVSLIKKHKTLKALRTDDTALEKAAGLKRGNTGKTFEFSDLDTSIADTSLQPALREMPAKVMPEHEVQDATDSESKEHVEEDVEELQIYIKICDAFGDEQEYLKCNEIEDQLEQILESEFLGRWAGHEIGAGFFEITFVGDDGKLMFEALKGTLINLLPTSSYVQVVDSSGRVVVSKY
jgi:hypothetical protein